MWIARSMEEFDSFNPLGSLSHSPYFLRKQRESFSGFFNSQFSIFNLFDVNFFSFIALNFDEYAVRRIFNFHALEVVVFNRCVFVIVNANSVD